MQVYNFEDKYNELDYQFADYLKDKSVAIVGRAGLDDLEQGQHIDSHDVVVRLHQVIPYSSYSVPKEPSLWEYPPFVPAEWQSRIGLKTNVFYHKEFYPPHFTAFLSAFHDSGGKFIAVEYLENLWSHSCCEIRRLAPCRYLTNDHFLNVMESIGAPPFAGTIALGDILRHDIKSLYITGFPTFYTADGSFLAHEITQNSEHKVFMNFNWIRNLCRLNNEITTDTNMEALFRLVPEYL